MAVYGTGLVHLPNLEHALVRPRRDARRLDVPARRASWPSSRRARSSGSSRRARRSCSSAASSPGRASRRLRPDRDRVGVRGGGRRHLAVPRAAPGPGFLVSHGPKVSITEERLQKVEGFFDRHGGKAILIGRFVGPRAGDRAVPGGLVRHDRCGASCPTTSSAPACGARPSSCSATSSGSSIATLLNYAKQGALALGTSITVVVGAVVWRALAARGRAPPACSWRGSTSRLDRPLLRPAGASCCVPPGGCCAARRCWRGTA